VISLWPTTWQYVGYTPDELHSWNVTTEYQYLDGIAHGYQAAAVINAAHLARSSRLMTVAWSAFLAAPLIALVGINSA
jgi:hypothetical protein